MSSNDSAPSGLYGDPGFPQARRLDGKVAVVTGAGSRPSGADEPLVGNGKATAILFARAGARVALLDERPDWAEETQRIIKREGGEAIVVEVNVADANSCERAVARTLEAFGSLHVLVNNVGVTGPAGTAIEVTLIRIARSQASGSTSIALPAGPVTPTTLTSTSTPP